MRLSVVALATTVGFLLACSGDMMGGLTDAAPATDAPTDGATPEPTPEPAPAATSPITVNGTSYSEADGYQCCARTRDSVGVGLKADIFTLDKSADCGTAKDGAGAGTKADWATCESYFAEDVCCAEISTVSLDATKRGTCAHIALEPTCDRYHILGGKIERAEDTPGHRTGTGGGNVGGVNPGGNPSGGGAGKTGKGKAGKGR